MKKKENETFEPSYVRLHRSGELKERVSALYEILRSCRLCPRECKVNRLKEETGFCHSGKNIRISSAFPHFGEEPPLVGRHGSGTIFLTGCNLGCVFCQNFDISQLMDGKETDVDTVARIMINLQKIGCHNINFVTPTHFVPQIVEAVSIAVEMGLKIPLVYNCGGYESLDVIKLLDGIFDIYMPDIKYGDNDTGLKYSKAKDYFDVATRVVTEMHRQVGDLVINDEGLAERGLIIRHLVLPNGLAGTERVMNFIANLSKNSYVNIMEQYRPMHKANQYPELNRRITYSEYIEAISIARAHGLSRGFPQ